LKVTTQQTEDCVTSLTIEVDDETMAAAKRKAAQDASRRFQIPGFRKGKAPYDVIVRLVGDDYLTHEALENVAPELVAKAIEEQEIEPYSRPELTEMEAHPPRITVNVPTEPVVELGDYRSVKVEREPAEVTDEAVDEYLDELRRQRGHLEPIERPLQVGDVVNGRMLVEVEDGPKDDDESARFPVPSVEEEGVPGLSEHLVGAIVGDVVEFDTVFPVDHPNDDIAGKKAHVTVELNETHAQVLPELNDEFAVMMGDYDDLANLRQEMRQRLEGQAKETAEEKLRQSAVEALVAGATIKYPQAAVEDELDRLMSALEQRLRQQRISLEAYYQAMKTTREELRERQRPVAEKNVREGQALRQLIKEEGIEASDEELTARINRMAQDMGAGAAGVSEYLSSPEFRARVAASLVMERGMRRLVSIVTGEPEPEEEEIPLEEMPSPAVEIVETAEGEDEASTPKEE